MLSDELKEGGSKAEKRRWKGKERTARKRGEVRRSVC